MIRTMIARLSVIACFVACAGVAERAHAQGSCPAVGTVTGTSIEGYAFDATTLEKYSDGAVVTIGTVLKMTGDAVAGGWCDVRYATAQG